MAMIWGVGGTVDENGRLLFSQCLRSFLKGVCVCVCVCVLTQIFDGWMCVQFHSGLCMCESYVFKLSHVQDSYRTAVAA